MTRQELIADLLRRRAEIGSIAYSPDMTKEDKAKIWDAIANIDSLVDRVTYNEVEG